MITKQLIISLSIATALCAPAQAAAPQMKYNKIMATPIIYAEYIENNTEEKARTFIETITSKGLGFIENKDISDEERKTEFKKILQNSFDMKTIARFALGRYWRTITPEQKNEYLRLFEEMIVNVYSRRFNDYNGEKFEVLSAYNQGNTDSIVSSQIVPASGAAVAIDWRVRNKNGELKVIDILVEGVSMSMTQRSDFASVIQRGGGNINILLDHLR